MKRPVHSRKCLGIIQGANVDDIWDTDKVGAGINL